MTSPITTGYTAGSTTGSAEGLSAADFGAGYSEALTGVFEEGQALANEAAASAFAQQTADGVESMKQQTMAKQISNAIKNSNLVNY